MIVFFYSFLHKKEQHLFVFLVGEFFFLQLVLLEQNY